MILFFQSHKSTAVRVVETGTFFCLYCEADRFYELREYRTKTNAMFVVPINSVGGKFVLCGTCGTAFDPECLDESSTADLRELEVDVPGEALRDLGGRIRLAGDGASSAPTRPAASQGAVGGPRRRLSGHSELRRH